MRARRGAFALLGVWAAVVAAGLPLSLSNRSVRTLDPDGHLQATPPA